MNHTDNFVNTGLCQFKDLPVNELFSYHGEIYLKLNDCFGDNNSFNIRTLNFGSIPYGGAIIEHIKLKKESSYLLKISYSWGDTESDQEFDTFEHAWEHARQMALDEAEVSSCDHKQEVGLWIEKSEECNAGLIVLHYIYDNSYCYYHVGQEIQDTGSRTFFDESAKLLDHLKFWCSGCGDLHYHGERDVLEEELPDPLQYAYRNLWSEGAGCLEYIVEYDGEYYLAIEYEYDRDEYLRFRGAAHKIDKLLTEPGFGGCRMVIGEGTEPDDHSAIYALVPAKTSKEDFNKLESRIVKALYNE